VKNVTNVDQCAAKTRPSLDPSVLDNPAIITLLQMEDEEDARLLREEQELISLGNELELDENTDWLRGCS
jgi:hypothetical protein